jgi:hypothetical protein
MVTTTTWTSSQKQELQRYEKEGMAGQDGIRQVWVVPLYLSAMAVNCEAKTKSNTCTMKTAQTKDLEQAYTASMVWIHSIVSKGI